MMPVPAPQLQLGKALQSQRPGKKHKMTTINNNSNSNSNQSPLMKHLLSAMHSTGNP